MREQRPRTGADGIEAEQRAAAHAAEAAALRTLADVGSTWAPLKGSIGV